MDLFNHSNDWAKKLDPILQKYNGRKHPLDYHNLYQLVIMVILSAQEQHLYIHYRFLLRKMS